MTFKTQSIPHINFDKVNLSLPVSYSEKLDGSAVQIGKDNVGLYFSREDKNGSRHYIAQTFDIKLMGVFSDYLSFVHSWMLKNKKVLDDTLKENTKIECEVILGEVPNATYYSNENSFIVLLRTLEGVCDLVCLKNSINCCDVEFTASSVKSLKELSYSTKKAKTKTETVSVFQITNCVNLKSKLDEIVSSKSILSTNGVWIEGVVLNINSVNYKYLNKDYCLAKDFLWSVTNAVSKYPVSVNKTSFLGETLVCLANTVYSDPRLGTSQRKRLLDKNVYVASNQTTACNYLKDRQTSLELKYKDYLDTYMFKQMEIKGKNVCYNEEVHERTKKAFYSVYNKQEKILSKINISNITPAELLG